MHEEEKDQCFSRRSIIATAPLVPLVGLGAAASAAESAFSPAQLRVIEAFVDRLIPRDENGPEDRGGAGSPGGDENQNAGMAEAATGGNAGLDSDENEA